MRRKLYAIPFCAILLIFMLACGGPPAANSNGPNTNVANGNTKDPLAVATPTPESTTNNAPTLTPVYKAYCSAMVKKDEAALRKIYSSDTIKDFEEQMKADKIKSLIKFLEVEQVSNELCEVRNEQISGDSAVAEVKTIGYPKGFKVLFIKEGGEWKISNKRPPGSMQ